MVTEVNLVEETRVVNGDPANKVEFTDQRCDRDKIGRPGGTSGLGLRCRHGQRGGSGTRKWWW